MCQSSAINLSTITINIVIIIIYNTIYLYLGGKKNGKKTDAKSLRQGSASFCEAAKTIFQALVLSGKGQKLDPLSTVLVPWGFSMTLSLERSKNSTVITKKNSQVERLWYSKSRLRGGELFVATVVMALIRIVICEKWLWLFGYPCVQTWRRRGETDCTPMFVPDPYVYIFKYVAIDICSIAKYSILLVLKRYAYHILLIAPRPPFLSSHKLGNPWEIHGKPFFLMLFVLTTACSSHLQKDLSQRHLKLSSGHSTMKFFMFFFFFLDDYKIIIN